MMHACACVFPARILILNLPSIATIFDYFHKTFISKLLLYEYIHISKGKKKTEPLLLNKTNHFILALCIFLNQYLNVG